MDMILPFFIWMFIGVITAYFAQKRGRDPLIWFMIGMLLGVLGLIVLLILPASKANVEPINEKIEEAFLPSSPAPLVPEETALPFLTKEWFYIDSLKQQQGPISFDSLKKIWYEQQLSDQTYVWSEGMEGWEHIGQMPQLKEVLNK